MFCFTRGPTSICSGLVVQVILHCYAAVSKILTDTSRRAVRLR